MRTVFLQDRPAKSDSFGAHERIANSIATMIENEEEGKAVSLMGTWGSGKSTIIKLLEDKFATDAKTAVFTYDAWEHKKDPIRRSYIEEFHDFLLKELKVIKKKQFEYDLNRLSCNIEDKETTSEPKVTTLGKWAFFFLYLVPLALILLKVGLENSQQILVFPDIKSMFLSWNTTSLNVGIFLLFWPFIFAGICRLFGKDIFNVFTKQTITTDKSNTIKTNDPTTIEFKEIYKKILKEAVQKGIKIIVVIDNLDRMNRDEVLDLWATMQTLLDVGRHDPAISRHFWLIVPFDQATPQRVWDCEACSTKKDDESQEKIECKPPCASKRDQDGIGKRFVNKTFQVTIKVPPIRLTSWKEYFLERMSEAFPDNTEQDHYACFSLFELFEIKRKENIYSPTPREIIIFINRVAAIHNNRKEQIPLPIQALYVLREDNISIPEEDISPSLFGDDDTQVLQIIEPDDWRKYFAAMYFGIDVDLALSVLMSDRIKRALEKGDIDGIKKCESIPGINDILINVLSELIINTKDSSVVRNSIAALNEYNFNDDNIASRSWMTLACRFVDLFDPKVLNEESIESYKTLLTKQIGNEFEFIVAPFAEHMTIWASANFSDKENAFGQFKKAIDISRESGVEDEFKKNIRFGSARDYVWYLSLVSERLGDGDWDYLFLDWASKDDLSKYFSSAIEDDQFDNETLQGLVLLYSHNLIDENVVYSSVKTSYGDSTIHDKDSSLVSLILRLSLELAFNHGCGEADDYLATIVNDGGLFYLFKVESADGPAFHPAFLALLMYLSDINNSYASSDANSGLAQFKSILKNPDGDWVDFDELSDLSIEYNCAEKLTRRNDDESFKPFVQYVVNHIIDTHDEDVFTPEQFVSLYSQLSDIVEDYSKFSNDYLSRNDIRDAVASSTSRNNCKFYSTVFKYISDNDKCIQKVVDYLNGVKSSTWKTQVEKSSFCFLLAQDVFRVTGNGFLSDHGFNYLKTVVDEMIETDKNLLIGKNITMIKLLDRRSYNRFIEFVFSKFENNEYNNTLLKSFVPIFNKTDFLDNFLDDYTTKVLTSLLICDRYYGVGFVRARVDKEFTKKLSPSVRNRFYDSIVAAYDVQSNEGKRGIKDIGKKLGIKRLNKSKRKKKK